MTGIVLALRLLLVDCMYEGYTVSKDLVPAHSAMFLSGGITRSLHGKARKKVAVGICFSQHGEGVLSRNSAGGGEERRGSTGGIGQALWDGHQEEAQSLRMS